MNYKTIQNKIYEVKEWRTLWEIESILLSQGIKVSASFIYKHTKGSKQEYKVVCKTCGDTFYYKYIRKFCEDCSGYAPTAEKRSKEREHTVRERIMLNSMLEETKEITWLSEAKIQRLLLEYTHTEIRNNKTT